MMRVLVTGASGFVGSHLTEALATRGDEVVCLVRKTSRTDHLEQLGVTLAYGDVTDRESLARAVEGVQVVYHVAGCTLVLRQEQYYRVNQQGVRNLAQVCAEQNTPPVLVLVSSLAAVGPAVDGRPRREDDPPVQVSHYGRSKRAGELEACKFADRLPISIVRPPMVFGEADPISLSMFRPIARFGLHFVNALGRQRVSLIHAADLAQLLILTAQRGKRLQADEVERLSTGCYFAADPHAPSYAELGPMLARALEQRRVLVVPSPPRAVWVLAALNWPLVRVLGKQSYLNFDRIHEVRAGSWLCSAEKANRELGFSVAASLEDRFRQTADWYRRKGWL